MWLMKKSLNVVLYVCIVHVNVGVYSVKVGVVIEKTGCRLNIIFAYMVSEV